MGVIAEVCDRVAVPYAGRVAEIDPVRDVVQRPSHPYTAGLMASIPMTDEPRERLRQIDGAMPRPGVLPGGCAFHPRCTQAIAACSRQRPALANVGSHQGISQVACLLAGTAEVAA